MYGVKAEAGPYITYGLSTKCTSTPMTEHGLTQDLGNTNYCVFMPRVRFERKTNALLVSDALNSLDINTYVNDRNDICIDGYKIGFVLSISGECG